MLAVVLALPGACRRSQAPASPTADNALTADADADADDDLPTIYGDIDVPELDGPPAAKDRPKRPGKVSVTSLDAAHKALATGNPEGAAEFLRGELTRTPTNERLRIALAVALLATGEYDDAEKTLAATGKAGTPTNPRLRLHAHLRTLRGDFDGAEALLGQAVARDANDLAAHGQRLALWVTRGRGSEPTARAAMDALYDAYDAGKARDADALIAVAHAALARGSSGAFHDANMVLGEAEKLPVQDSQEPGFARKDRVLLLRGAVFRTKYAASEAVESYTEILQRDAWHADAHAGIAAAYLDELNLAGASVAAETALDTNPHHPDAHAVLARVAVVEGRRDEAIERATTKILRLNPHHPTGLAVLAAAGFLANDEAAFTRARDTALATSSQPVAFYLTLSDILVSTHMYPYSDRVLAEAIGRAPQDPSLQSAYGLNLLRLGREPEGRAALAKAWKRDRFNERTRNTLDLYDKRIDPLSTDVDHGDLKLRLPTDDAKFVQANFIAAIDRARTALDARYNLRPSPLRIEVFADPQDFSVRTVGVPSLGAVGVCFGNLITSVGSYQGTHNFHQVLWHELAHVYAVQLSGGRVPRWFTEGLSEWESELADPSWARESAELLAKARREGRLRRLGELDLAFLRATSPVMMEVAYATSAWAMRYLGETYGLPRILQVLRGYASGATTEALFRQHFGHDMATVEAGFAKWMNTRLDQTISGWHPDPKGAKSGDPRDKLLVQAMQQIEKKDLKTAAHTLQQLIQNRGDGYRPRMLLAEVLLRGAQWRSAGEHLQRAREFHREAIDPIIRQAELARRQGDIVAEKRFLRDGLAIDGMSFDPAARLAMLALVSEDSAMLQLASDRAVAIAPLHPLTLGVQAWKLAQAGDRAGAGSLNARALSGLEAAEGRGPADTLVVMALACAAAGDLATAKVLATRANAESGLPKPAKDALQRLLGA